jgi:anti-sigma-K factor RskA
MEPSPQVREKLLTQIRAEKSGAEKSAANVLPFDRSPRTLWNSLGSFGSIAAVILFAALIVSVVVLYQQNRVLQHENAFYKLLTAPGSRIAELSGTPEASGAAAKLAYDPTGRAVLIVNGLPRAPEGKEYQLWYIVDNKPLPGKTFAPDNSGNGKLEDQVPEAARQSAIFAITLEPAGGGRTPTGAIYLRGEL